MAFAVNTVLTFRVKTSNVTANAPEVKLNVPLNPLSLESLGVVWVTLPLRTVLSLNKVAVAAVIVNMVLPLVTIAPLVLSMDILLSVTLGETTSNTFPTLISGTLKVALWIVVVPCVEEVPAVMVMSKLPLAVNNVLLLVPKVKTKSLAPS